MKGNVMLVVFDRTSTVPFKVVRVSNGQILGRFMSRESAVKFMEKQESTK
jgi:hypothetical protein